MRHGGPTPELDRHLASEAARDRHYPVRSLPLGRPGLVGGTKVRAKTPKQEIPLFTLSNSLIVRTVSLFDLLGKSAEKCSCSAAFRRRPIPERSKRCDL